MLYYCTKVRVNRLRLFWNFLQLILQLSLMKLMNFFCPMKQQPVANFLFLKLLNIRVEILWLKKPGLCLKLLQPMFVFF